MDKTCTLPLADGHGFDTYFIKDLFLYFPVVTFSYIYIYLFIFLAFFKPVFCEFNNFKFRR